MVEIVPWMNPEQVITQFFVAKKINPKKHPWYTDLDSNLEPYTSENPALIHRDRTFDYENANIGWKIRINTLWVSIKQISEYLIKKWYKHKYLTGGESEEWTMFTLYIGSYKLVHECANTISNDLKDLLLDPIASQDILVASKISGRFNVKNAAKVMGEEWWSDYGYYWFPISNWFPTFSGWLIQAPHPKELVPSFMKLWEKYWEYFFDPAYESSHTIQTPNWWVEENSKKIANLL